MLDTLQNERRDCRILTRLYTFMTVVSDRKNRLALQVVCQFLSNCKRWNEMVQERLWGGAYLTQPNVNNEEMQVTIEKTGKVHKRQRTGINIIILVIVASGSLVYYVCLYIVAVWYMVLYLIHSETFSFKTFSIQENYIPIGEWFLVNLVLLLTTAVHEMLYKLRHQAFF